METLTSIQDAAINYMLSRSRPNDHRCKRVAFRMVKDWCVAQGWDDESANGAGREMWDVYLLEKNAE